jgi:hypothetical protein
MIPKNNKREAVLCETASLLFGTKPIFYDYESDFIQQSQSS